MTTDKETEGLLRQIRLRTSAEEDERILGSAVAAMDQSLADRKSRLAGRTGLVRTVCRNHWAQCVAAGAAAIFLVAVGWRLWSGDGSGGDAVAVRPAVERDQPVQPVAVTRPAGGIGSAAAGPEWVTTQKGQMEAVLGPPGPGEVRLERNLDGKRMNRRVGPDGWIGIGGGLFWRFNEQVRDSEGSGLSLPPERGKYLEFVQEDVRVYVIVDGGPSWTGVRGDWRGFSSAVPVICRVCAPR